MLGSECRTTRKGSETRSRSLGASAYEANHLRARWFSVAQRRPSQRDLGAGGSGPEQKSPPPARPASAPTAQPTGRKPNAVSQLVGRGLPSARENIYTLPNLLTVSRLAAAPFIGWAILHDHHALALGLFAWAGLSDLLDGWIARRWNQKTVVGTVIDPMADKTLMTVLVVALATKGALPVWLAILILGRDVALGISAIYYRWISLPPPKTFTRYWDFSLPSAEVHPTTISKYNTALQLGLMGLTTLAPVVPVDMGGPLTIMQYVVAATTVWSGASYVYTKDAVKILSQPTGAGTEQAKTQDKAKP